MQHHTPKRRSTDHLPEGNPSWLALLAFAFTGLALALTVAALLSLIVKHLQ